jgi:hypothetical protein
MTGEFHVYALLDDGGQQLVLKGDKNADFEVTIDIFGFKVVSTNPLPSSAASSLPPAVSASSAPSEAPSKSLSAGLIHLGAQLALLLIFLAM